VALAELAARVAPARPEQLEPVERRERQVPQVRRGQPERLGHQEQVQLARLELGRQALELRREITQSGRETSARLALLVARTLAKTVRALGPVSTITISAFMVG
jgi:hypothetical protein